MKKNIFYVIMVVFAFRFTTFSVVVAVAEHTIILIKIQSKYFYVIAVAAAFGS